MTPQKHVKRKRDLHNCMCCVSALLHALIYLLLFVFWFTKDSSNFISEYHMEPLTFPEITAHIVRNYLSSKMFVEQIFAFSILLSGCF